MIVWVEDGTGVGVGAAVVVDMDTDTYLSRFIYTSPTCPFSVMNPAMINAEPGTSGSKNSRTMESVR